MTATETRPDVQVNEKQARQVAEAAREADWQQAQFRQGALPRPAAARSDPPAAAAAIPRRSEAARRSWPRLRDFCGPRRRRADRARRQDPRRGHPAAQGARRLRDEDPQGVRRPRPVAGVLQQGAARWPVRSTPSLGALLSAHQSIGVPQPLQACSAPRSRSGSTCRVRQDEISAFLLTEPDVGSDPARLGTTADTGRRRLPAQRRQAVDHQRRHRRRCSS